MLKFIRYNFRLPSIKNPDHLLWVNAISKHQIFSEVDKHTLSYNVCSWHFDPSVIKHGKDRGRERITLVSGSFPTRFPNTNNLTFGANTDNATDIMEIDKNAADMMEIDNTMSEKQRYILYTFVYVFIPIFSDL